MICAEINDKTWPFAFCDKERGHIGKHSCEHPKVVLMAWRMTNATVLPPPEGWSFTW